MFVMNMAEFTAEITKYLTATYRFGGAINQYGDLPYDTIVMLEDEIYSALFDWQEEINFDSEIINQIAEEIRLTAQVISFDFANDMQHFSPGEIFNLSYIICLTQFKQLILLSVTKSDKKLAISDFIRTYNSSLKKSEQISDVVLWLRGHVKYWRSKIEIEDC